MKPSSGKISRLNCTSVFLSESKLFGWNRCCCFSFTGRRRACPAAPLTFSRKSLRPSCRSLHPLADVVGPKPRAFTELARCHGDGSSRAASGCRGSHHASGLCSAGPPVSGRAAGRLTQLQTPFFPRRHALLASRSLIHRFHRLCDGGRLLLRPLMMSHTEVGRPRTGAPSRRRCLMTLRNM